MITAAIRGPGPALSRAEKPPGAHAGSFAACGEATDVVAAQPQTLLGAALEYNYFFVLFIEAGAGPRFTVARSGDRVEWREGTGFCV